MKRIALIFPKPDASLPVLSDEGDAGRFAVDIEKFTGYSLDQLDPAVKGELLYLSHCLRAALLLRANRDIPSISFVCGSGAGEIIALTFSGYITLEQAIWAICKKQQAPITKSEAKAHVFSPLLGRQVKGADDINIIISAYNKTTADEIYFVHWLERKGVKIMLSAGKIADLNDLAIAENSQTKYFELTETGVENCSAYLAYDPGQYLSVVSECMATMVATPNKNALRDSRMAEYFDECRMLLGKNNEVNATAAGLLRLALLSKGFSAELAETCVLQVLLDTGVQCLN